MEREKTGGNRGAALDAVAEPAVLRRDLAALLAGAGLVAACTGSTALEQGDGETLGVLVQAASGGTLGWADTVLGAVPPAARTGDLATKNSANIGNAIVVIAKGCVAAGDGGGGVFYWDSSSTSGDDGGTIIVPTVGGGRWVRIFTGPLSVNWFGARNGGAIDVTGALAAAITAAGAQATDLFWPSGDYLTTASLSNLHSTRHRGAGRVKRGSDYFAVEPKPSNTNRIYMATNGSASNDGLSSSQPISTFAASFAALSNYGPILEGSWKVIVAAGTYATLNVSFTTPSRNLVVVQGPAVGGTPNVPAALVSGSGASGNDFGLRASGQGVQVYWQDLKFQNYGNIALLADYGADLWTNNVHAATCTGQAIYGESCGIVRVAGGIIDGARQGILLNACAHVTIGYGHSAATQMVVKNCTQCGIEWSRGTHGHCDFVTLQGNPVGLDIFHDSRCHVMASVFTSNTTAIRARTGGFYYLDAGSGGNVYSSNTNNWLNYAASGESDSDLWLSPAERRRGFSLNSYTHTGTTTKTVILSPWTIPADFFKDSTKKVRVRVHGEFTTAGSATKIGVAFDGVDVDQSTAVAPAANAKFVYEVEIWAVSDTLQYKSATLYQYNQPIIQAQNSPAQTMTSARNVNITFELANAAHVAKIFMTEIWVTG